MTTGSLPENGDGLDWLSGLLAELSPEEIKQLLMQTDLLDQGDFVTHAAKTKFEAGRMAVDDYVRVVERQHGLMQRNKADKAR